MTINHDLEIKSGGNYTINANSTDYNDYDLEIKNRNSSLTVNATVKIQGDLEIKNRGQLTVKSYDTLIIGGDAEIEGFLWVNHITIEDNAVFIIKGDLFVTKESNIRLDGTMLVEGSALIRRSSTIDGNGSFQSLGKLKVELWSSIFGRVGRISWDGCPDSCQYGKGSGLPIDLASFEAILNPYNPNSVKLKWTTMSEVNNDYFLIEHSYEGAPFEVIAKVAGAGNSNKALQYQENVSINKKGKHYFRLRQVDYNGNNESFKAVVIDNGRRSINQTVKGIKVFPNPSTGSNIKLLSELTAPGNYTIAIFNERGQNIHRKVITNNDESAIFVENILDGKKLERGLYFVKVYNESTSYSEKIIVR